MYADETIREFVEHVAARTPTPGGGSVAALAGAFGGALGMMGARYSIGRDPSLEADAKAITEKLEKLTQSLLFVVDEDAAAYERVVAARKMPKVAPEDRDKRKAALDAAFLDAIDVPMRTIRFAKELSEAVARLAPIANPNLITDVAVGAILAEAAFEGARLNVLVNLPSIPDSLFRTKTIAEMEMIGRAIRERKTAVTERVEATLK
ncbi:MAG: cyclodeaminase/cyclohydrolase family protein [Planctomycetes bacterium]|nr:cyclodeaminase/cyclohydrolase family protein [Planctomycetota bacterium]MBI3845745.1 cyclodeaminase/cyclohydrolase family protein [Planctomycetota bacterium]